MASLKSILFIMIVLNCLYSNKTDVSKMPHYVWNWKKECVWETETDYIQNLACIQKNKSPYCAFDQMLKRRQIIKSNSHVGREERRTIKIVRNVTGFFRLPHKLQLAPLNVKYGEIKFLSSWQSYLETKTSGFKCLLIIAQCSILFFYASKIYEFCQNNLSYTSEKVRIHNRSSTSGLKPQSQIRLFGKEKTDTAISFIFRMRICSTEHSFMYPASLDHYFQDVFSFKQSKSDLLRYEWARYESFRNYPDYAAVMPSLLAKDGFYFTGYEDEVTCYFCGLRYKNFKRGDNVHNIHSSLSKNCTIMTKEQKDNVSINDNTGDVGSGKDVNASGDASDTLISNEKLNGLSLGNTTENPATTVMDEKYTNSSCIFKRNSEIGNRDECIPNTDIEVPKYPYYEPDSVRLSSYSKWPTVVEQNPKILCDAGFFYGGYGDCVRCFFCGGGLRNWEYGDTPWIEHARWYPKCAYLLQHKGRQFIDMYRHDSERKEEASETGASCVYQKSVENEENKFKEDNSPTVQSLLEMGFARDMVLSVLETLHHEGKENISASDIMERILEEKESSQDNRGIENNSDDSNKLVNNTQTGDHLISKSNNASPRSECIKYETMEKKQQPELKDPDSCAQTYLSNDCQSLMIENQRLKDQLVCKICMDNDACMVYLPCGHMVSCQTCALTIKKCCICRKLIQRTIKAYL